MTRRFTNSNLEPGNNSFTSVIVVNSLEGSVKGSV